MGKSLKDNTEFRRECGILGCLVVSLVASALSSLTLGPDQIWIICHCLLLSAPFPAVFTAPCPAFPELFCKGISVLPLFPFLLYFSFSVRTESKRWCRVTEGNFWPSLWLIFKCLGARLGLYTFCKCINLSLGHQFRKCYFWAFNIRVLNSQVPL